jgi:hypothetical protein
LDKEDNTDQDREPKPDVSDHNAGYGRNREKALPEFAERGVRAGSVGLFPAENFAHGLDRERLLNGINSRDV